MGGPTSGKSRKRRTLTRSISDGALARADKRGREVRAVLEGVDAIEADSGDSLSFLKRRVAQRTMHLDQLLARDELAMAQGRPIDVPAYLTACATWLRYSTTLGLKRVPRKAESLADIRAEYARKRQEDSSSEVD